MNLGEILLLIIVVLLLLIAIGLVTSSTFRFTNTEELGAALRRVRKSNVDSTIAGVCAGFGKYTPIPAWIWRVFFLVLLFCGGIGLIAYLIFAICMPSADD